MDGYNTGYYPCPYLNNLFYIPKQGVVRIDVSEDFAENEKEGRTLA